VSAKSLDHPGLIRVGNDEAVVIPHILADSRAPALSMMFEQVDDDTLGLRRRAPPLQAQPNQIHAEKPHGAWQLAGMQGLVADGDSALVDPVLEAPQPPRTTAQDGQRFRDLRDFDILAPQCGAVRMAQAGRLEERLAFRRRAVAVLGEQGVAVPRRRTEEDQGIAARLT